MSSSPPSNTTTTVKNEMPDWVKPYAEDYLTKAGDLAENPFQAYTGDRIAGISNQSITGMDMAQNTAFSGTPYADAAMQSGANIMGSELTAPTAQTYTGNASGYSNPYTSSVGDVGTNQYAGQNPYLQDMIDQAKGGVVDSYNTAVRPQLSAMEVQSGAFGNSGLQQLKGQALSDLTNNLGDIENKFRFQDYTTQQGLAENALNRDLQARQYQANLAQQGGQFNAGNEQQMNLANMNALNTGEQFNAQNALQAAIANQTGDLNAMQQAATLEGLRYMPSEKMLTVGDQLNQYNQALADDAYQAWMAELMYPYQQLDILGNAVGLTMGSGGTQTSNAPNAYRSNTAGDILGAGLTAYGLLS